MVGLYWSRAEMKRVLVAVLLVVALGALASACDLRGSQETSSNGLLTRSVGGDGAEMTALLRGTLKLDANRGCVLLSGKPVIWPTGTTMTMDPPVLHLPGGLSARSGDVITGGGGEIPGTAIWETALRIEGDLTRALECAPTDGKVLVFTARGDDVGVSSQGHPRPCRVSQLRMRISFQGATGTLLGDIVALNTSPYPCLLRGRPKITLELTDGDPIRSTQGTAPPAWRYTGRKPPRGWPVVRLAHNAKAQAMIVFRNWCGPPDQRVRFNIRLPSGGGELPLEARIRLRCDLPGEPVSLRVGPFEPRA